MKQLQTRTPIVRNRKGDCIMIHEQFITPETAKLAKQAEIDWESRFDNQQQYDEWQQVALVEVSNPDYNDDAMGDPYSDEFIPFMSPTKFVMLPHVTQSVLQRWLRELHNLIIVVKPYYGKEVVYGYIIYQEAEGCIKRIEDGIVDSSYESTLEVAEQKCLTLLIEKQ